MKYLKTLCLLSLITAVCAGCGLNKPTIDEQDNAPEIKMEEEAETGKAADLEESTIKEEPVIEETFEEKEVDTLNSSKVK